MLTALIARRPSLESTPRGFEGLVIAIASMLQGSCFCRRLDRDRGLALATPARATQQPRAHLARIAPATRSVPAGDVRTLLGILRKAPTTPRRGSALPCIAVRRPQPILGPSIAFPAARCIDQSRHASRFATCVRNSSRATGARDPRHGMDRLRTRRARCSANSRHARGAPAGATQGSPSSHRQGPTMVCLASPLRKSSVPMR